MKSLYLEMVLVAAYITMVKATNLELLCLIFVAHFISFLVISPNCFSLAHISKRSVILGFLSKVTNGQECANTILTLVLGIHFPFHFWSRCGPLLSQPPSCIFARGTPPPTTNFAFFLLIMCTIKILKVNIYVEYIIVFLCRLFNNNDSNGSLREELEINSI